jgi:hypothetical protein
MAVGCCFQYSAFVVLGGLHVLLAIPPPTASTMSPTNDGPKGPVSPA